MSEKETFWLGIDCGGTYLKAGLYNHQGEERRVERCPLRTLSTQPGYAERDMDRLWQCCHETIATLLKAAGVNGKQIKGIAISAQGKGLFLLDKQDHPLGHAMLSSDHAGVRHRPALATGWDPRTALSSHPPDAVDRAPRFPAVLAERE